MTKNSDETAARHARSNRKAELVDSIPPDVYGEGTVMRYFKAYDDEQDYAYLAVKTEGGKWFQDGEYLTWRDLLYRIDEDNIYSVDSAIQIAVEWKFHTEEGE